MSENEQWPESIPDSAEMEELLRSFRFSPGERMRLRMARAPWMAGQTPQKGVLKMNRKPLLAALAVIVLVLVAGLLATPAGSVLAGQVIQFFVRAPGNTVALPTEQIFPPVPSATPEPTRALALLPAEQVAEMTPTALPAAALDPDALEDMSLAAAEETAGFDVLEPTYLPGDYRLKAIRYDPGQQAVSLRYASPQAGSGEFFEITEGKQLEPFNVGPGATVETVAIGPYAAEFVRGGWFVANGSSAAVWEDASGTYTLRWQAEDLLISIGFFLNDDFSPAYIQYEDMLAVARSLARCPAANDLACESAKAAVAAGFAPWQFSQSPDGLTFRRVDYRPGLTALWYTSGSGQFSVLQSRQTFTALEEEAWAGVPGEAIQNVSVAGQPGEYVRGSFMTRPGEGAASWDEDSPLERLRWQNSGWWFQIIKVGEPDLSPQQFADLAGRLSMQAPPVEAAEPQTEPRFTSTFEQAYVDLAALEAAAGIDILEPGRLPEGLAFSHARYDAAIGTMLFYGSFAEDKYHSNGPVLIVTQNPLAAARGNITDAYPGEALRQVTVNGNPAWLIHGSLMTEMATADNPAPVPTWVPDSGTWLLAWKEAGLSLTIQFNPAGRGERLNGEDLIEMAESLH